MAIELTTILPDLNLTSKVRSNKILFDDKFDSGMCGWCQLATPSTTATNLGAVFFADRGSFSGNCVGIRTSDVPISSRGGEVMGLKRSSLYFGEGKHLIEFWFSILQITADITRPQYYSYGLDTAKADGTRQFFETRWLNYDEAAGARAYKWQVKTSSGWEDIIGGQIEVPMNENKDLVQYLAMEVDLATGKYIGFRLNNQLKLGTLADDPLDTSLSSLSSVSSSLLTPFAGGINATASVANRTSGTLVSGQTNIHRCRVSSTEGV